MSGFHHLSVMKDEVVRYLAPKPQGVYVDGTLGGAGHAAAILEMSSPDGRLIGFDRDPAALGVAAERLKTFGERVTLVHENFAAAEERLRDAGFDGIDGFLLDLGVSSHQLDTPERGFSFQYDAPLDMRMNPDEEVSAADLLQDEDEGTLERIFREYGEERFARRIARRIVETRGERPLRTTFELVDVVKGAIPRAKWEERIHPATRTFQALRIAVNHELESVEQGVRGLMTLLRPGGRGVVITFHSLEDRIVKHLFRDAARGCTCPPALPLCVCGKKPEFKVITNKPVVAGDDEVEANPRARSAKLRVVEKVS